MSSTTITLNGNSISLVASPGALKAKSIDFTAYDQVATVVSPYTGQTQTQSWPGAESWGCTLSLPPMCQQDADTWTSALMELRGQQNAIQLVDPARCKPRGNATGTPVANTSGGAGYNAAGTTTLYTRGWTTSTQRLLLPGTNVQVGYRLYRVLNTVASDSSGNAALTIWPSLREVPADGAQIILKNPAGLFRLSSNQRKWSLGLGNITTLSSIQLTEYR